MLGTYCSSKYKGIEQMTLALVDWHITEGQLRPYVVTEAGEEEAAWAPQPGSQTAFMSCPAEEVIYEGNRGGGKTDALLMDFAQHVDQGFGAEWRGILFRQTYPQLSDVIVKSHKWFPMIWPGVVYNDSKHVWTWPTGETLTFSYGMREKDYIQYHGKSWPWIGFEELTTWADPTFFLRMFSCIRSSMPGMPRKIRITTNPYGPGHNWVKTRYHLPVAPGEMYGGLIEENGEDGVALPERISIHSHLDENQILLTADPGYKGKLIAAAKGNASLLKAWLHGSWDIMSGGMLIPVFGNKHGWSSVCPRKRGAWHPAPPDFTSGANYFIPPARLLPPNRRWYIPGPPHRPSTPSLLL